MADFCQQCLKKLFGLDTRDLSGLSTPKDTAKGRYAQALCESCGLILVDHKGKRIKVVLNARKLTRKLQEEVDSAVAYSKRRESKGNSIS